MNETRYFIYFLGVCFAILLLLIGSRWIFDLGPKTLAELHAENYNKKSSDSNYIYNGFSFLKLHEPGTSTQLWYTEYQKEGKIYAVALQYGPKELEYIPLEKINKSNSSLQEVYLTFTPDKENKAKPYLAQAWYEISEKLVKILDLSPIAACTENITSACADRPIVSCDTVHDAVVIEFIDAPETKIVVHDNCIEVEGRDQELLKAANKLIYLFLDVV